MSGQWRGQVEQALVKRIVIAYVSMVAAIQMRCAPNRHIIIVIGNDINCRDSLIRAEQVARRSHCNDNSTKDRRFADCHARFNAADFHCRCHTNHRCQCQQRHDCCRGGDKIG